MTTLDQLPAQVLTEEIKKLREEIERKTGKTPEALYAEREKRVRDAIELRQPDRVPVSMAGGYFAARYAGLTASVAYYDAPAYREALKKATLDFEPDTALMGVASGGAGRALEILDAKQTRWPGGTLPADVGHQFIEGEYMHEDEYDLFLMDPTDFTLRYYLPRVYGALEPLAHLPPLMSGAGSAMTALVEVFTLPAFRRVAAALLKAGEEQAKWRQQMAGFPEEMAALGFPSGSGFGGGIFSGNLQASAGQIMDGLSPVGFGRALGGAPFDAVSDFYRGMRGSMLDMYRRPEKLLAACDKVLELRLARAAPLPAELRDKPRRVGMPLHRGAQGFMSREQFETFYWPGLKQVILSTIEMGFIAAPFFEGHFDDRLEYLLEIPKGKMICRFEHTDMARAKAVLGGHFCIEGNVPSSLLQVGSPTEVEEYCKKLIEVCGKGGGFILSHGSSIDEAKPANVKAMLDSAKKYGWS